VQKLLSFFLLIFFQSTLIAQSYWTIHSVPRARQLHDIHLFTPQHFSVVGGNPTNDAITFMGHTSDAGQYWSFNDIFPGELIKSSVFYNHLNGICVGNNETIYKTYNGGYSWLNWSFNLPLENGNVNSLYADNNITFAAGGKNGGKGFVLRSNNFGNTWLVQKTWLKNEVYDVSGISYSKLRVCGNDNFLRYSDDGGIVWKQAIINGLDSTVNLYSLSFFDSLGVCVGGSKQNDTMYVILKSLDEGRTWATVEHALGPVLNDVIIVNASLAYAVGDKGIIFKSTDTLKTWNTVYVPNAAPVDLFGVNFTSPSLGGIVGSWGYALIYNEAGENIPVAITNEASGITKTSAQLNGLVFSGGMPASVSFLYGTQNPPENIIFLDSLYNNFFVSVGHKLENLQHQTKYYFRLKVSNNYGDSLGAVKTFYTGNPIPNWDFEEWILTDYLSPDGWYFEHFYDTISQEYFVPFFQTSEAFNNSYAICVQAVNNAQITLEGKIAAQTDGGFFPINERHETFEGYLRYYPENLDTATLNVVFYNNSLPIASGILKVYQEAASWKRFIIPIYYSQAGVPDAASIEIRSSASSNLKTSVLCIDKLSFDSDFVPVEQIEDVNKVLHVYPNPFTNILNIELLDSYNGELKVELINTIGEVVYQKIINQRNFLINTKQLEKGFYILKITHDSVAYQKKIIKME